jgi:CheY-like chemotaxis protein
MSVSVLVVEDEPLIALDIEEMLTSAGCTVAAILDTCEAAEVWLASNSPDVAILDIQLKDGTCESVARTLHERSIPFVVHSGSEQSDDVLHPIFREGSWVAKPASQDELAEALRKPVANTLT